MLVSLLVLQKLAACLRNGNALQAHIQMLAQTAGISLPIIGTSQIVSSSAGPELADNNIELTYPRVCLYTSGLNNSLMERFRAFSGTVTVAADIWATSNLVTECEQWIHYYLGAFCDVLKENRGDWGDGVYFSGIYQAQLQPPKAGGMGFIKSAKLTCTLDVSQS